MYAQVANDFSPVIRFMYNAGASVISKGMGVQRATDIGSVLVPDPVAENSPTRAIIGIEQANQSVTLCAHNVIGIAVETITTSTWGPVCVGGPCQALASASMSFAVNLAPLAFITGYAAASAMGSPYQAVPCIVCPPGGGSASFTVAALGLIDVFIEPVKLAGGGGVHDR